MPVSGVEGIALILVVVQFPHELFVFGLAIGVLADVVVHLPVLYHDDEVIVPVEGQDELLRDQQLHTVVGCSAGTHDGSRPVYETVVVGGEVQMDVKHLSLRRHVHERV